jgi:hypothetical protein
LSCLICNELLHHMCEPCNISKPFHLHGIGCSHMMYLLTNHLCISLKHILVHLGCHSIIKTKQGPFTTPRRWMDRIWSSTGGRLGRWRSRAVAAGVDTWWWFLGTMHALERVQSSDDQIWRWRSGPRVACRLLNPPWNAREEVRERWEAWFSPVRMGEMAHKWKRKQHPCGHMHERREGNGSSRKVVALGWALE